MIAAGQWERIYVERHAIDARAAAAVEDMPFPGRRFASFCALAEECGEDALEALTAAAEGPGTAGLGRRHWADLGARHVAANAAAEEVRMTWLGVK